MTSEEVMTTVLRWLWDQVRRCVLATVMLGAFKVLVIWWTLLWDPSTVPVPWVP